jgi:hypothetical protein
MNSMLGLQPLEKHGHQVLSDVLIEQEAWVYQMIEDVDERQLPDEVKWTDMMEQFHEDNDMQEHTVETVVFQWPSANGDHGDTRDRISVLQTQAELQHSGQIAGDWFEFQTYPRALNNKNPLCWRPERAEEQWVHHESENVAHFVSVLELRNMLL